MKSLIFLTFYFAFITLVILFIGDSSYIGGRFHMERPVMALITALLLYGVSYKKSKD